ncbi:MAG: hypothetical protein AB1485_09930, partial [Candidatus Thermoplasmatota archaeon]
GQTSTYYYGGDAAQSGAITHNQNTYIQTTVKSTKGGTLTFYWKVSSESGYDFLRFYIDGTEQSGKISGTTSWAQKSFNIASGSHTLKWAYTKDGSVSSGSDCGWVDKVVFNAELVIDRYKYVLSSGVTKVEGQIKHLSYSLGGATPDITFYAESECYLDAGVVEFGAAVFKSGSTITRKYFIAVYLPGNYAYPDYFQFTGERIDTLTWRIEITNAADNNDKVYSKLIDSSGNVVLSTTQTMKGAKSRQGNVRFCGVI